MTRRSRSNWTAVAVNEVFPIFFAKTCRAAQFFKNAECSINPLFACLTLQFALMFIGYGSPIGPPSGTHISRLNRTGKYRHQKRNQPSICFWKEVFGFRAKSIRDVRFSDPGLHP